MPPLRVPTLDFSYRYTFGSSASLVKPKLAVDAKNRTTSNSNSFTTRTAWILYYTYRSGVTLSPDVDVARDPTIAKIEEELNIV